MECTTVSLQIPAAPGSGAPEITVLKLRGPSPVNARRAANDLAREMLARLGRREPGPKAGDGLRPEARVRVQLDFERLLNFSYELDADVVLGLADLNVAVDFTHREFGRPSPMSRLGDGPSRDEGCTAAFRLSGEELRPDSVTQVLGIDPSMTAYVGERTAPRSTRRHSKSSWILDGTTPPSSDTGAPVAELLERLPTTSEAWSALSREHRMHVLLNFQVYQMTGYFDLAASTVRRVADAACGLDFSFHDWGPAGADCLR